MFAMSSRLSRVVRAVKPIREISQRNFAMSVPQDLLDRFVAAGQEHVFRFLDAGRVPAEQVPAFIAQLEGLDLEYVSKSYRRAVEDADSLKQKDALSPPDEFASVKEQMCLYTHCTHAARVLVSPHLFGQ